MSFALRIAVADDEPDMRDFLQRILARCGHNVVSVAQTGRQLIEQCRAQRPDLIITDIGMPDVDGVDASREVVRDRPTPVIVISARCDANFTEPTQADHVMAYLVKPIGQADLKSAIALAMRRFNERQTPRQEAVVGQQSLPDCNVADQAKGIVIRMTKAGRQDGFRPRQQPTAEKGQRFCDAAQARMPVGKTPRPATEG